MIWSSAQPKNVKIMVDRAFGPLRSGLKHVWARDTLGLSKRDFCEFTLCAPLIPSCDDLGLTFVFQLIASKVQTVKDLNILWRDLPEQVLDKEHYSALNTVLLDDSALKARLQPHNHLPLPEYDAALRKNDLATIEEIHKHKRTPGEPRQFRFDPSLLAVIGVLDELSRQDSVCAWIHADGLWAGFKDQVGGGSTRPGSDSMAHNGAIVPIKVWLIVLAKYLVSLTSHVVHSAEEAKLAGQEEFDVREFVAIPRLVLE
jgi:NLI interacting factor-like phosphatase